MCPGVYVGAGPFPLPTPASSLPPLTVFLESLPESPTCSRYKEEICFNEGPLSNGHLLSTSRTLPWPSFQQALWRGRALGPLAKEGADTGQTPGEGQSERSGSRETPGGPQV